MAKILIVEDNQGTNKAICEYMKEAGHTLFSAFTGSEALKIFREKELDIIVLDIMLAAHNGHKERKGQSNDGKHSGNTHQCNIANNPCEIIHRAPKVSYQILQCTGNSKISKVVVCLKRSDNVTNFQNSLTTICFIVVLLFDKQHTQQANCRQGNCHHANQTAPPRGGGSHIGHCSGE